MLLKDFFLSATSIRSTVCFPNPVFTGSATETAVCITSETVVGLIEVGISITLVSIIMFCGRGYISNEKTGPLLPNCTSSPGFKAEEPFTRILFTKIPLRLLLSLIENFGGSELTFIIFPCSRLTITSCSGSY